MSHRYRSTYLGLLALLLFIGSSSITAQQKQAPPFLTQRITKHDRLRLGYGGTVTIVGPPQGSISIEGWDAGEVEVLAEVELQAPSDEDLKRLASVNGFALDEDLNHLRILTTGTHDKNFMRRVAKDFPKKLLSLPWKMDYKVRVPRAIDLEIDAGSGPITIAGVEGALRITASASDATLLLSGGTTNITIGSGNVKLRIPGRGWRGAGAELRLAEGTMEIQLPAGFSGEIDAEVLRAGLIKDDFGLEARSRSSITPTSIKARAGVGGAYFHFVVGNGSINITKAEK